MNNHLLWMALSVAERLRMEIKEYNFSSELHDALESLLWDAKQHVDGKTGQSELRDSVRNARKVAEKFDNMV